jgi:hypothetical protein
LRDRKINVPEGANNRLTAIRGVCKWAVKKKHPDGNPYLPLIAARAYLRAELKLVVTHGIGKNARVVMRGAHIQESTPLLAISPTEQIAPPEASAS